VADAVIEANLSASNYPGAAYFPAGSRAAGWQRLENDPLLS